MSKAPTSPQDRTPFSERFANLADSVETLYLRGNLSGRKQFRAAWPNAARFIFGETLMEYDARGGADRDARAREEDEAEDRRHAFAARLTQIREKSVEGGLLQLRYIESVIHEFGREIAQDIYASWVIEKIFPPPPSSSASEEPKEEVASPEEIAEDFNAPAPVPVKPAPVPARFSPDLAAKKRLVEVAPPGKGLSYRDVLAWAERLFSKRIAGAFNQCARPA